MDLLEETQRYAETAALQLTGLNDFDPVVMVKTRHGDIAVAHLLMPDEEEGRAAVAAIMAAVCGVNLGVEATFCSAAWVAQYPKDTDMTMQPDVMPSQHPDRQEIVSLVLVNAEGRATMHSAPIIRENNLVGIGLWEQPSPDTEPEGRFISSLRLGLRMAKDIPADMADDLERMDSDMTTGLIRRIAQMIQHMSRNLP